MTKKILSIALAAMLLLSLVSAASAAEITKENYTIKFLGPNVATDMNNDYVAKMLEEKTGFKVLYDQLPSSNADERLMMEVASGTDYDLMLLNANQYRMLLNQNALVALDDLLADFPGIQEALADAGWAYVKSPVDGKTYGIPQSSGAAWYQGITYRRDLFEKYGWEIPNTPEEFYNLCVEIKATTGLIPFTARANAAVMEQLGSGFGLGNALILNEDGSVSSWLRDPKFKEYLAYMNKLYAEGLMDVDYPVNNSTTVGEKISTGKAVMVVSVPWTVAGYQIALREIEPEAEFGVFLPLSDENGEKYLMANAGVSSIVVIPKGNEDTAKLVLSMIEARLEPDMFRLIYNGIEGVHYYFNDDGVATPIQPAFGTDLMYADKFCLGFHKEIQPLGWLPRIQKVEGSWEMFTEANVIALDYDYTRNPFQFASYEAYDKYNAALTKKLQDYCVAVVAGTESLDHFDDFLAGWEADGGLEIEEAAAEWAADNEGLVEAALSAPPIYKDLFLGIRDTAK